ncbi:MAG TPA: ABC transporter ATP-binding protein [Ktedonobacteraceae bacterium]|jgi:ABC-type lipoprotein export system ATPase subunit|nr:ABC transporter ATP-binding protein [Ktedonobacteraceae bacterium]
MASARLITASLKTESELPQIRVENVSKEIGSKANRTLILADVSFDIPRACLFAINGPSGSGKSTMLNILTGIDRPTAGRVLFDGEILQKMSENRLAKWRGKHVGIVFQFFQLLPTLTALENILLALELGRAIPRRQWRERALECLALVGMDHYARRLPSELSGGQQQRVAIARALANDPPVLVADEPTGNLDSKTAIQIFDVLGSLTDRGKTVVYVTHDPVLAARAASRIDLLDGRVVGKSGVFSHE